jgi:hypothetical protein
VSSNIERDPRVGCRAELEDLEFDDVATLSVLSA